MKSRKGLWIGFAASAAALCAGMWFYLQVTAIPDELKTSRNDLEEGQIEVVRERKEDAFYAAFYPVFEHENLNNLVQSVAVSMFEEDEGLPEEVVKVDFTMTELNEGIVSILFDFDSNMSDKTVVRSVLLDTEKGIEVDSSSLLSEKMMKKIGRSVRNTLRKMKTMGDEAWTMDFYARTDSLDDYKTYWITEDQFILSIEENEFGNHAGFTLEYNLSEMAHHVNLDLGIESSPDPLVEIPERYVDPDRPMVALTFDDGPHKTNTLELIDIFDEVDQAATFYIVGSRIPGSEHLIIELANHGHEVASHSYSHPRLTELSGESLHFQLTRVSELVSELSDGAIQVKTLRPPYGKSSQRIKAESPYPFILWNVDSLDWKTRNTEAILEEIRKEVSDGDVILLHELYQTSVEAVRILVPELIEQGYQLVTVEEMFAAKGIELKAGSTYFDAN